MTLIQGDVIKSLQTLPSESIDCIMTSPPYWALRDYGMEGQIGFEPTFEEYLEHMLQITSELKKVLKKTGTFWLNIGDTYSGSNCGSNDYREIDGLGSRPQERYKNQKAGRTSLPDKCLMMIPERLVIDMIDQGWILRNKIIWHKPNHMPSSVKDRLSNGWEYLYLFVKNKRYFFDLDSIREPHKTLQKPVKNGTTKISAEQAESLGSPRARYHREKNHQPEFRNNNFGTNVQNETINPLGKNPGDVWEIPTHPFPDSHFAVFPPKLCERPIKAGCPDNGTVLDPFAGSGTVGKVAIEMRRNAVLIELNLEYCDMIKKRLNWGSPFLEWEFKVV